MLLPILPFFLAAKIIGDEDPREESRWRYGSESTFQVLANTSLLDVKQHGRNLCSAVSMQLKCRAKDEESLTCRFANVMATSFEYDEDGKCSERLENFVDAGDRFVDLEPFEIRFNPRGIENLVVRRTVPRWKLDFIKAVVSQLHLGFRMDASHSWRTTNENSSLAYCDAEVRVEMGYEDKEIQEEEEEEKEFELVVENEAKHVLERGGIINVEKFRNPGRCPHKVVYFAAHGREHEKGIFLEMVSSTTRITISKKRFYSYTVSEGATIPFNGSNVRRARQKISVTLQRVDPAQAALHSIIRNPASTSIHTHSSFGRYPRRVANVNWIKVSKSNSK